MNGSPEDWGRQRRAVAVIVFALVLGLLTWGALAWMDSTPARRYVSPPETTVHIHPTTTTQVPGRRALVTEVADGDTLRTSIGRVRLIGVDTPETRDPRKPVQCYGPEASAYTKRRLTGRTVTIRLDTKQGTDPDAFGRTLAYVYLGREHFNLTLVARGYARAFPFGNRTTDHRAEFARAEAGAKAAGLGLWGACSKPAGYIPTPAGLA